MHLRSIELVVQIIIRRRLPMGLLVSSQVRDDGEVSPTSINLANEWLLAGVTINMCREGTRSSEALLANRTDMLLVATVRVLCTECVHHGCLIRIAIKAHRWLQSDDAAFFRRGG